MLILAIINELKKKNIAKPLSSDDSKTFDYTYLKKIL